MFSRGWLVFSVLVCAAPSAAQQTACDDSHVDEVGCFQRWDMTGFYFAAGKSLTTKQANIATELLSQASTPISPDPVEFPAPATLVNAYLYRSGARETPDESVTLAAPGAGDARVVADKWYLDSDNRIGSISKNFYTCRADIMGVLNVAESHFGTWTDDALGRLAKAS